MRIKILTIAMLIGYACGEPKGQQESTDPLSRGSEGASDTLSGSSAKKSPSASSGGDSDDVLESEEFVESDKIAETEGNVEAGIITAGNFDDNLNFQSYLNLIEGRGQTNLHDSLPNESRPLVPVNEPVESLEILFVVDTTGSMGDELNYLKAEILSIADTIKTENESISLSFGLVVYRDKQDEYLTKDFPFTDDVEAFRQTITNQGFDGGGDYPEAMDQALAVANGFQWSASKRVIFLVADAPPHSADIEKTFKAADDLATKGVMIYPIAASGVDAEAEFVMRTVSVKTGGEYLFLTDDSGVGSNHAEPTIPCYNVLLLKNQITNAVKRTLTGETPLVNESEVLRKVGTPQNGVCQDQDAQ